MNKVEIVNLQNHIGQDVLITGWVIGIRDLGKIRFVDILDATGSVQIVVNDNLILPKQEDYIEVEGRITKEDSLEILATRLAIKANFKFGLCPLPHSVDLFNSQNISGKNIDNLLSKRHIYLRNPKFMAVLKFRHKFFRELKFFLEEKKFIEIHCPILTETLLYDESTAFSTDYFGNTVYLTQCVAFYLEACVAAFDRVYCISPSFRAEVSHGKRHLAEYWHLKTEILHANLETLINFVEDLIYSLSNKLAVTAYDELSLLESPLLNLDLSPPYERISYKKALGILKKEGLSLEFGKSLSPSAEKILSTKFSKPFFVIGLPASLEPFPYTIDACDPEVTMTADLYTSNDFGEILGIAEKISKRETLENRAKEKEVSPEQRKRLEWYFELRDAACLPHGGMGMGIERTIRWFLGLSHVRDAIPFPRLFKRRPIP